MLLKPNLVEPNRKIPHMTTHPAMIVAAAEVFRRWGAEVSRRRRARPRARHRTGPDRIGRAGTRSIRPRCPFADLNYEQVGWIKNPGRVSPLKGFYFPASVVEADLVVSMPKMKTHHWVGFTAALKNMYGTIPGIKYGWPKNVLHHAGIPQTVYDINASLPKTLAIVDGIAGMEGDGPILGSPKQMGLVIVGTNPTAVDATIARIMGLEPDGRQLSAIGRRHAGPGRQPADRSGRRALGRRGQPVRDSRCAPFARAAEAAGSARHMIGRSLLHPPRTAARLSVWLLGGGRAGCWLAMALPMLLGRVYVADDLGQFHLPLRQFYSQQLAAGEASIGCPRCSAAIT